MEQKSLRPFFFASVVLNVVLLVLVAVFATLNIVASKTSVTDFKRNNNIVSIEVPANFDTPASTLSVPALAMAMDKSEFNYEQLIAATNLNSHVFHTRESDYSKYAKSVNLSDYATLEDVFVELFANLARDAASNGEIRCCSMPLSWYAEAANYDFTLVNIDRLRLKCELIAQRYGLTTYGRVYLSETYFSVNLYPIK